MRLNINAVEMELTEAIRSYVEKKFESLKKLLLKQDCLDPMLVKLEIGKTTKHHNKGILFKAEAHLRVGKMIFDATSTKEDLYAAIDEVKDELMREITSKKEKTKVLAKKGGRAIKKILQSA